MVGRVKGIDDAFGVVLDAASAHLENYNARVIVAVCNPDIIRVECRLVVKGEAYSAGVAFSLVELCAARNPVDVADFRCESLAKEISRRLV